MAIRFTPEYNAKIRQVVKNFNQKRNRAIKKGYQNVPEVLSVIELRNRYDTRAELNRALNLYKSFSGSKEALKKVENSGGAKAIQWEFDYLKDNLKYAKEFYDREIEEARSLDTPLKIARAEYLNNLKAKRAYLDLEISNLSQSQFRTFKRTIDSYIEANTRNTSAYRGWLSEVEEIMKYLGYDKNTRDKFFNKFKKLTPRQFVNMYRTSSLISRVYEMYNPSNKDGLSLTMTDEDAKETIDTLLNTADDLVAKAQQEDQITDSMEV